MKKIYFSFLNMFDLARRVLKLRIIHDCYHFLILRYLKKKYSYVINRYSNLIVKKYELNNMKSEINTNAWAMWWQGENQAPFLVKRCLENSNKVFENLIIIDKYNYNEFVSIPDYIIEKFEKGIIPIACFSDIIRFSLLSKYGGTWIDATIFLKNFNLNEELINPYSSVKGPDYSKSKYVPKGKWRSFFQYGEKNFLMFQFVKDFLIEYWKNEDNLINFFLMDYTIEIAYRENIGNFKTIIDKMPDMSVEVYELDKQFFYSDDIDINFVDNHIFKLNTKHNYPMEVNGKDSNYKKFIENKLF